MSTCCIENPYKQDQCKQCYQQNRYHCTWPLCLRPVLCLTLCRSHYRRINVNCAWTTCNRPSFCKQVCAHHYRKSEFPPVIRCNVCNKPQYMNGKCFYHFTYRNCIQCNRKVFSKQLCNKHYMRQWRTQRPPKTGPTINNDTTPETRQVIPDKTNHIPVIQSSLEQSDINA